MLLDERLRRLLCMRSRVKEVSEASSMCEAVRSLAGAERMSSGGEGMVVFDVCSGKGLGATLLSFLLPRGRVVMLDSNGGMDLSHLRARPNLSFRHVDLFSADTPAVLREEASGASYVVAVGMHLCGALSPRLIDLAVAGGTIDAMALCPCCLKGAHGKAVARSAAERSVEPYAVLVETLQAICEREIEAAAAGGGARSRVGVWTDREMLSPKNRYITVQKWAADKAAPDVALCQACA